MQKVCLPGPRALRLGYVDSELLMPLIILVAQLNATASSR
jgi:hypothetical protein